jgi:catechol 2,3-dioxygenase-like lactoylglutathione lyase family enzyme
VNAFLGVGTGTPNRQGPSGISHVAVVTADLDGFRAFYEDAIGLETMIVLGAGAGHGRQAIVVAGQVMLHVFELSGYDPAAHGFAPTMFERGRLDHLGFTVVDEAALEAMRDRLLEAGASSGDIRRLGPMLSVRFRDPEGFEGEVNCLNPAYDPSAVRAEDEIVDPNWFERTTRVLRADFPSPRSNR